VPRHWLAIGRFVSISGFTSSFYGGGGFLAVDIAAPGLYGLEALEHGTVGVFNFDLVDRAAVTSRSITMAYSLLMSTGKRV
jgi:hypothetical protein